MRRLPNLTSGLLRELDVAPATPEPAQLFLSCRHDDAGMRAVFETALARRYGARFQCEWDEFGDDAGWRGRCEEAIRDSEGLVCLIGPSAGGSLGIPWEVRTAMAQSKPVVVVPLDGSPDRPQYLQELGVGVAAESVEDAVSRLDTLLLDAALMPSGDSAEGPLSEPRAAMLLEQYRLLIESSESLQARRQSLHTFFMSINSLFIAAIGLIGQQALDGRPGLGAIVSGIGVFGLLLCGSWRRQIRAYGKVSSSKFDVINRMEKWLPSSPYLAEWVALVQKDYESFTDAERRIPMTFQWIHGIAALAGVGIILVGVL